MPLRAYLFGLLCCVASSGQADVRSVGEATIDIKRKKPNAQEEKQVRKEARIKAFENYIAKDQTKLLLYDRCLRDEISDLIDDLTAGTSEIRREVNKKSRELTMVVRVGVVTARLDNNLRQCGGSVPGSERAVTAFVFLGRQKTGPDEYRVIRQNRDVEAAIEKKFRDNAFELLSNIEFENLSGGLYNKNLMEGRFARHGKAEWIPVLRALGLHDVDFLAYGTFDFSAATVDDASGLVSVNVTALGRVIEISNMKTLSVESPVIESALGPDEDSAIAIVQTQAAEKLARKLISQLSAAGIK